MDSHDKYQTFADFWLFYLSQHRHPLCRGLHYIGSCSSIVFILASIWFMDWSFLMAALLVGYAFAWVGHFFIEHNRPATFTYPLWSFLADFYMLWRLVIGQLTSDLQRLDSDLTQNR